MTESVRQHLIDLFGLPYEDTEEGRAEFASYLRAKVEADAQRDAYVDWAQAKSAEIADGFTAQAHTQGWLPEELHFEWAPANDKEQR